MNKDNFWQIIAQSRADFDADLEIGNMERQSDRFYDLLSQLKPKKIIAFDRIFHELLAESYRWDLWGAAYILSEGMCSEDSFDYFRSWLISMGQEVYEKALENPDSLVEFAGQPGVEDIFFEEFANVAPEVYLEKTGEIIPAPNISLPPAPLGEQWQENPEDLNRRFPGLWAKFGDFFS